MKSKMVVGFMFNENETDVLLIEKKKPKWQFGKFNGIGGKCEDGEPFINAMVREFKEETGIDTKGWFEVTTIGGEDWEVMVYALKSDCVFDFKTMEEETVNLIPLKELDSYNLISNLYWLIPMCLDALHGEINYGIYNSTPTPTVQPAVKEGLTIEQIIDEIKPDIHAPVYSYSQLKGAMDRLIQTPSNVFSAEPVFSKRDIYKAISYGTKRDKMNVDNYVSADAFVKSLIKSTPIKPCNVFTLEQMKECWKAAQYNLGGNPLHGYDTFESYISKLPPQTSVPETYKPKPHPKFWTGEQIENNDIPLA